VCLKTVHTLLHLTSDRNLSSCCPRSTAQHSVPGHRACDHGRPGSEDRSRVSRHIRTILLANGQDSHRAATSRRGDPDPGEERGDRRDRRCEDNARGRRVGRKAMAGGLQPFV
jgi:hypothetical protein